MHAVSTLPSWVRKAEFALATVAFVFAVFLLDLNEANQHKTWFDQAHLPFGYYRNYVVPSLIRYTSLYLFFVLMHKWVAPQLLEAALRVRGLLVALTACALLGTILGVTDTYARPYLFSQFATAQETYGVMFQQGFRSAFLFGLLLVSYFLAKTTGVELWSTTDSRLVKYQSIIRDGLLALAFWLLSLLLLITSGANGELLLYWSLLMPVGILLFCYAFAVVIPGSRLRKRPLRAYFIRMLLAVVAAAVPVIILVALIIHEEDTAFGFGLFTVGFHVLLTAPFSWVLYARRLRGKEEMTVLKQELGQSHASLDFLRSQINPHFLFNALNTLYGTALQENSERTAHGIQMLGDMMRFMLHENHQHKILLSREIEYLRNYIELQCLRIATSPNITIQTTLDDTETSKCIPPMLLIPFVENAFKHGISLKDPSWIRITLHCQQDTLYFDVCNSLHPRPAQGRQSEPSGLCLENVRQRLSLLYPSKEYELITRETVAEYFVHLTVKL